MLHQIFAHQVLHQPPLLFGGDREAAMRGEIGARDTHRECPQREDRHRKTDQLLRALLRGLGVPKLTEMIIADLIAGVIVHL